MDLDDAKAGSNRDKAPRESDLVSIYKFPEKKWVTIRLVKGMQAKAVYWVKTKTKAGKITKFPLACPSFDPVTQERDTTKYDPWRDLGLSEKAKIDAKEMSKDDALVQYGQGFWMQAIIRSAVKSKPSSTPKPTATERKTGFKDKDSDSWTPMSVVQLGKSFIGKVQELKGLNTVESAKTGAVKAFAVNDDKFGRDIRVYYDSTKAPADQYQIQLGEKRTPLSEDEQAYLSWDLGLLIPAEVPEAEVKRDFESWASRNGVKLAKAKGKKVVEEDEDDEEDDEEEAPKSKKKPAAKKPAKNDDFDEEEDDEDEEDDEPPAKKSKAPAKGKKVVEEDEDDFDDEEEDEEEEAPKSKKKPAAKKPAPAKGKKPAAEDEDEDEDDFDDEDEEDDEPPAKKSKAPAKGKKVVEEDEDDFDDEEEDEEEEAPKSKKKPAPAKGKKPAADDFDDEEEDDEDEEDDEPPAKKKAAPVKGKKPAADEEDDEDF